ncbi:MAG: hypothetical protein JXB26_03900 [Candidatus Aminicenantes bacterium]|nr:hypothetical protein [Candidatus Aminicenantes bacterium]
MATKRYKYRQKNLKHIFHRSETFAFFILTLAMIFPLQAYPETEHNYRLKGHLELGYLAVVSHRIQFSEDGTYFPYHKEGAQDNLFFINRMSLDFQLSSRHTLIFLYQPLSLQTKNILERDIKVDGLVFPQGTPMRFVYNFPFYRLSYLYDLNRNPYNEFSIGLSLQIRNATIEFESLDGTLFRSNRDIGPVPILKFRWRRVFDSGFWLGSEADGFYAPISYINGSDNEVVGAILDASFRMGVILPKNTEAFLNIRYLGGGAVGTSEDETGPGDGYVKNWLHFLTVTVGISVSLF